MITINVPISNTKRSPVAVCTTVYGEVATLVAHAEKGQVKPLNVSMVDEGSNGSSGDGDSNDSGGNGTSAIASQVQCALKCVSFCRQVVPEEIVLDCLLAWGSMRATREML